MEMRTMAHRTKLIIFPWEKTIEKIRTLKTILVPLGMTKMVAQ